MTKRQEGGENVRKKTAGALCLLAAAYICGVLLYFRPGGRDTESISDWIHDSSGGK